MQNYYTVTPWASWRNYRTASEADYRSLISNERTHEYFLLEGKSAEIWQVLTSDVGCLPSLEADDLNEFILSLQMAGLLHFSEAAIDHTIINTPPQEPESESGALGDSARFERDMMDWAWQLGFLFSAHLELTYRCNEKCIHCYNPGASLLPGDRPKRQRSELDTAEWMKIMSQLAEIGVFRLSISGGEATLRKDFFELVAYARELGFAVVIFTNGLHSNPLFVEKLAELWPHSVEVSIYSATPELHDQVTGVSGSFQRSIDCLRQLHTAGIRTTMKTVLMGTTVSGYADCRKLAKSLGASLIMDTNVSPNVDGRKSPIHLNPTFDALVELAMVPDSPTTVVYKTHTQNLERSNHVCGAGTKTISINPEGEVSPCTAMPWVVGTARDGKLAELWHAAIARRGESRQARITTTTNKLRDLANWQAVTLRDFDECGTHERCKWCDEICPGDALVLTGNPLAPVEHRCKAAAARMTASQKLSSGQAAQQVAQAITTSDTLPSSPAVFPIFWLRPGSHGF
jgi:radical SAM protein with 4Fe4S-binding SPASM domain